jgi:hypothetical protein
MKIRILMLSLLGLIFFNSCSSDSNSSNSTTQNLDPNTILPKKIISEDGSGTYTYDFYYNQNKIDYIHLTYYNAEFGLFETDINFTYTGNLISEIECTIQGFSQEITQFTYQNNKLINKTTTTNYVDIILNQEIHNIDYVYNSDETISTSVDGSVGKIYTINNDNLIIKISTQFNQNNVIYSSTSSPFINILGIKEGFLDLGQYDYTFFDLDKLFASTIKNILYVEGSNYDYIYNDILFPTKIYYYEFGNYQNSTRNYQIFYQ